jgi:PncC family amidohydrolase
MQEVKPLAEKIVARLVARRETIAIAESSTGGLIAAALVAVPGTSAWFVGGAVVYTKSARAALLGIGDADMQGLRAATEAYSSLVARRARERHDATWGLGETGASGPIGNRYGDPAGPHLPCGRRAGRANVDLAHGQRRPPLQHGGFRPARAGVAGRSDTGRGVIGAEAVRVFSRLALAIIGNI